MLTNLALLVCARIRELPKDGAALAAMFRLPWIQGVTTSMHGKRQYWELRS
jgi:hypothetical protein